MTIMNDDDTFNFAQALRYCDEVLSVFDEKMLLGGVVGLYDAHCDVTDALREFKASILLHIYDNEHTVLIKDPEQEDNEKR